MAEIPPNVLARLVNPAYARSDVGKVDLVLRQLDVRPNDLFVTFYRTFKGPFYSRKIAFELLDLDEGEENIASSTILCREQHELPQKYISLTGLLAGAVLLYDTKNDKVYNVDFEGGDLLLKQGELQARWSSFKEFLEFYFT